MSLCAKASSIAETFAQVFQVCPSSQVCVLPGALLSAVDKVLTGPLLFPTTSCTCRNANCVNMRMDKNVYCARCAHIVNKAQAKRIKGIRIACCSQHSVDTEDKLEDQSEDKPRKKNIFLSSPYEDCLCADENACCQAHRERTISPWDFCTRHNRSHAFHVRLVSMVRAQKASMLVKAQRM